MTSHAPEPTKLGIALGIVTGLAIVAFMGTLAVACYLVSLNGVPQEDAMEKTIAVAALPLVWPLLVAVVTGLVTAVALHWRLALARNPKTVPLADVLDVAGQAVEAAIKASGPTPAALKQAEDAAFAVLKAHEGQLEDDAVAELKALCSQAVALKAGSVVTAPGGASVAIPAPKAAGFVDLRILLALGTFGLGALFGWAARVTYSEWRSRRGRWPLKSVTIALLACCLSLPARAQTGAAAPASPGLHAAVAPPASTAAPSTSTALTLPAVDWKTVTFWHGPSFQAFAVNPKSLHPIEVPAGVGYCAGVGLGQAVLNGEHVSLVVVSVEGFLAIVTDPGGQPAGGVQVAPTVGFLGNAVAVGPLLTPYAADGSGFLTGGRPGTSWLVAANPIALWHLLGGS